MKLKAILVALIPKIGVCRDLRTGLVRSGCCKIWRGRNAGSMKSYL